MPVIDALRRHSFQTPQKIAISIDGCELDFRSLYARAECLRDCLHNIPSIHLQNLHLPENGRLVLLIVPNDYRIAEIFAGATASPHCIAVLSIETPAPQMKAIIKRLQPDMTICEKEDCTVSKILGEIGLPALYLNSEDNRRSSYERFLNDRGSVSEYKSFPEAPFLIGFTSGTTGIPKAFIRTRESWRKSLNEGRELFALDSSQNILAPGPMAHGVTLYALAEALECGQTFRGVSKFKPEKLFNLLERSDRFVGVPAMLNRLVNAAKTENYVFPNLAQVVMGAAKFDPQHFYDAKALFPNARILQYYGASELGFVAVNEMTQENVTMGNVMSAVGKPFPGVTVLIGDENGAPRPNNEIGTIFVKSDLIATGYLWGDDSLSFRKTPFGATVGDLGMIDQVGRLYVMGRAGNMIISGGNNIYLAEIEAALKTINDIDDAIAFGIDDATYGERLVAVLRFNEGKRLRLKFIYESCSGLLEKYKIPKEFYCIKSWPMTWSGKIARGEVEKMIRQHVSHIERLL